MIKNAALRLFLIALFTLGGLGTMLAAIPSKERNPVFLGSLILIGAIEIVAGMWIAFERRDDARYLHCY